MKPWINYHHLQYFKAIATEGSIARAAEKMGLGQPTLSAQLKQFEDTIGVQLFDREHKRLKLNEAGRMALKYAQEIFRLGDEMLEVLHDRVDSKRVHVQIGALDSVPKHLVLKVIQAAYRIGECTVSILEGKGDEMVRELAMHRIDLFVSNFAPSSVDGRSLYSRSIAKLPVHVFGSSKFKSLRKGFPQSLDNVPVIIPTAPNKLRSDLEHWFQNSGWRLNIVAETQDTSLQKLMAVEGVGVAVTPIFAVEDLVHSGDLIELGRLPGVHEELLLVAASRKIENPISGQLMRSFELK